MRGTLPTPFPLLNASPRVKEGSRARSGQRGMSLITLLLVGVVVGFLLLVGMKVFPTVTEYWAIRKAVQKAANDGPAPVDVQRSFERAQQIDDFSAVTAKDLVITRNGDKATVAFSYEKRIPLFGPAFLVLEYQGSSQGGAR